MSSKGKTTFYHLGTLCWKKWTSRTDAGHTWSPIPTLPNVSFHPVQSTLGLVLGLLILGNGPLFLINAYMNELAKNKDCFVPSSLGRNTFPSPSVWSSEWKPLVFDARSASESHTQLFENTDTLLIPDLLKRVSESWVQVYMWSSIDCVGESELRNAGFFPLGKCKHWLISSGCFVLLASKNDSMNVSLRILTPCSLS